MVLLLLSFFLSLHTFTPEISACHRIRFTRAFIVNQDNCRPEDILGILRLAMHFVGFKSARK